MRKFFIKKEQINEDIINIIGEDVNHIKKVLRLEEGEFIKLCDSDNSKNYISKIEKIEKDCVICKIIEIAENEAEGRVELSIFQGLPKADKLELIIQKGTELGVKEFYPVSFERSIVKLQGKDEVKKIERWQKISETASKQSGRDIIPKINNILTLKGMCDLFSEYDIVLVAYENEKDNTLKNELNKLKNIKDKIKIAVVIGPEGGIAEKEIELFKEKDAKIITLGNRILRTETVCLMCASIIMYELES